MSKTYHAMAAFLKIGKVKKISIALFQRAANKGHDAQNDYVKRLPRSFYRNYIVKKEKYRGCYIYCIEPKSILSTTTICFLAGGGGMLGPTPIHYARIKHLVNETHARVYMLLYPLAPEYNAGKACDWTLVAYEWLYLRKTTNSMFLIGDSSGANISCYIMAKTNLQPDGVILVSPATGLQYYHGKQMKDAEKEDLYLSIRTEEIIVQNWCSQLELTSPVVDPVYLEYSKIPPVQIYYGTKELFYPFIHPFIKKIRAASSSCETFRGKGLCHIWADIDFLPEGKKARKRMVNFMRTN